MAIPQATIPTDCVQERVSRIAGTRLFSVKSAHRPVTYTVTVNGTTRCTCPARKSCWHMQAVSEYIADLAAKEREQAREEQQTEERFWADFAANLERICDGAQARLAEMFQQPAELPCLMDLEREVEESRQHMAAMGYEWNGSGWAPTRQPQAPKLTCSQCGKVVPDRGQIRDGGYVCEGCKARNRQPQLRTQWTPEQVEAYERKCYYEY